MSTHDSKVAVMSYPVLALRTGEQRLYSPIPFEGTCYAVMLLNTPPLPGDKHPESDPMTVICAARYTTISHDALDWGWIHLDFDTKQIIGEDMVDSNFMPGQWYYMIISGGLGVRSRGYMAAMLSGSQAAPIDEV